MPSTADGNINPVFIIDHNWQTPVSVSSSFETQVDKKQDATEQRTALRSKPQRALTCDGLIASSPRSGDLKTQLAARSSSGMSLPLYCDESLVTAPILAGSSSISCDTTLRRFAPGHKAIVVEWDQELSSANYEVVSIQSMSDSSLTLSSPTLKNFPSGVSIFPLIYSKAELTQTAEFETSHIAGYRGLIREVVGDTALPATVEAGSVPAGVGVFAGLPVLDIPHDWNTTREGVLREGRESNIGLGSSSTVYGTRPFDTATLSYTELSREQAWKLINFFDSRAGAAHPFWYPHRTACGQIKSASTFSVTLSDEIPLNEYTTRKSLAIWYKDGTVDVRFITFGIASTGSVILTLNEALTSSDVGDIDFVALASLARFSSDGMEEEWSSLSVMETSLEIRGIAFSGDIDCEGENCEDGECTEPGSCVEPPKPPGPDDPGPPFEPKDRCIAGTPSVPMYYDLTQTWCSNREPIRAADLQMSDLMLIEIKDTLEADLNHPFGQDISDELKEVLFATHELEYAGMISRGVSRNPYHTRLSGTSTLTYNGRSGGELVEDSPHWEVEVPYMVGEEEHTLTIRMYAEWVDQSSSSNGDSGYGAWGSMFVLMAWTTEITMDYTEGEPYEPFNDVEFTLDDPFVGGDYVTGGSDSAKYVHPRMLFLLMTPTTYHSPIGESYHSKLDRDQFLSECFALENGSQWSSGSTSDAVRNCVFGTTTGGTEMRALGSLGGWTKSEFFNWACIENTAGNGMTILKPTNAGWDESAGELTLGSDVRMDVCTPPQEGISAEGHPDDLYQGVGGTHDGWRTSEAYGQPNRLMVSTTEITTGSHSGICTTERVNWGGDCQPIGEPTCHERTVSTSFNEIEVENYIFGNPENDPSTNRSITFKQYVDDRGYERKNFPDPDGCESQSSCWNLMRGSSSGVEDESTTLTPSTGVVGAVLAFDSNGEVTVEDGTISATVTANGLQKPGVGGRIGTSGGGINGGVFALVDEAAGTFTLYLVTGVNTVSILDQETDLEFPSGESYELSYTCKGSRHSATLSGSVTASLSSNTCEYKTGGDICLVCADIATTFNEISVSENNWEKVEITGRISAQSDVTFTVVSRATKAWEKAQEGESCEGRTLPEGCPGALSPGPDCNGPCTSTTWSMNGTGGAITSDEYPEAGAEPHSVPGGWHPPIDVGDCDKPVEPCSPVGCDTCPNPYRSVEWNFSGNYSFSEGFVPSPEFSPFIGGISGWVWAEIVCF